MLVALWSWLLALLGSPKPVEAVTSPNVKTLLKKGMRGASVGALQSRLKELRLYTASIDNWYWDQTVNAVKAFQKSHNLPQTGEVDDRTMALLSVKSTPTPKPVASPEVSNGDHEIPWYWWLRKLLGWNEVSHNSQLSVFWKWTNVPGYRSVIGAYYAWCAQIICAALEENGIRSSRNAAAASFDKYGYEIDYKVRGIPKGAIVTIRHKSNGGRHVTLANRDHMPYERIIECLGGNQNNAVRISNYDLNNETIVAVRWPFPMLPPIVKKSGAVEKTKVDSETTR